MVTAKKVVVTARTRKIAAPAASAKVVGAAPASAPAKEVATPAKRTTRPAKAVAAKPATVVAVEVVKQRSDKDKKPKLVRDSFTIPKAEYAVIDELKQRAVRLNIPMKKGELLRAGIKALAAMPDATFTASIKQVPNIKTGRPAK